MVLVRFEKYRAEDKFVKDVSDQKTRVADGSRGTITWGPLSLGRRGGDDIISLVLSLKKYKNP